MKRIGWLVVCVVFGSVVSGVALDARAQLGGEGGSAVAGDPFGAPATDPGAAPSVVTATGDADDFCRCVGEASGETVDRIYRVLDGQLISAGMEYNGAALSQVVATLQDDYQIPIQLDVPALEDAGIGPDEPVSINLRNISLRSALRLLLKQVQLTYVIQDEVLIITTPEEAESHLIVCVYDVRDLRGKNQPGSPPPQPLGASAWADYDPLMGVITSCVSTETWAENGGGEAEIRSLKPGLMVISQTQAVHDEIRGLLASIRLTLGESAKEDTADLKAPARDPDSIVTRNYLIPFGDGEAVAANQQRIIELLTQLTPNAAWDTPLADGQAPILTALPDRLVVRHTLSVQDEVQAALQDLGLASQWEGASVDRGGGGGFGGGGGGGMFRWPPESK